MKRRSVIDEDEFQAPSSHLATLNSPKTKRRKVCDVCNREFNKFDHLKRHMRVHSDERPFQCPACEKAFSRNDTLNRHLKVHKELGLSSHGQGDTHTIVSKNGTVLPASNSVTAATVLHDAAQWQWPQNAAPLYAEPVLVPSQAAPAMQPHESSNGLNAFATLALNLDVAPPIVQVARQDGYSGEAMTAPGSPIMHSRSHSSGDTPSLGFADWDPASQAIFGTDLLDSIPHEMAPFGFDDLKWPPELLFDEHSGTLLDLEERPLLAQTTSYIDWLTLGHRDELEAIHEVWPTVVDARPTDMLNPISLPQTPGPKHQISPMEPLPACSFVDEAARAFFQSSSNTSRNVLHRPTFDHRRHAPLLRLAMCASGAQCMGTPEGLEFANDVYSRMSLLLQQHWDDTSRFQLDFILCALLTQKHLIHTGKPHMLSRAFTLAGHMMAAARRCGLFSKTNNPTSFAPMPATLPLHDQVALDLVWRKWATAQSIARLIGAMLHMETVISGLFPGDFVPPSMPLASLCLSISTMQSNAFEAPDALTWARLYQAHQAPHLLSVEQVVLNFYTSETLPIPRSLDGWALLAILDTIRAHARSRSLARLPLNDGPKAPDTDTLDVLDRCRRTYLNPSRATGSAWLRGIIDLRYHGTSAFCCIDNELIQVAAGRDGAARAREAFNQLGTAWANTPLTRRALVHVGQIWRIFPNAPQDPANPFPDFESLPFKGALVLLAYSLATANQADEGRATYCLDEEVDFDEIGSLGVTTVNMSPMELASCRPVVRFILQGGPCSIFGNGLPISTITGRAAFVDCFKRTHARSLQGAQATAIGSIYAEIFSHWAEIVGSTNS